MKQAQTHPSVQRDMVYVRETKDDMLCLSAPGARNLRSYRAVLEVSPLNFSLKAEEEQEAIIERFAALIRSLSFPLQILVRNQRLVTMTQNPEQFVQDPWGSVVTSNAAIKVLKAQDATSAAAVAERFHLTRSEQQRLITFGRQEALVLAGGKRVTINIQASQAEHALITTNPVERAEDPSLPPGQMIIRSVNR